MLQEKEVWQRAFEEFAAESRRHLTDHPTDEELDLFARGGLGEDRREDIRNHIAVCPDCLRDVLEQKTFPLLEPPSGVPDVTDEQIEDRWQIVRRKLLAESTSERNPGTAWLPGPKPSALVRRRHLQPVWAALAAAALVLLVIGSFRLLPGAWLRAGRPSVNAQIASLLPEGSDSGTHPRGSEETIQRISLMPAADSLVLVLNAPTLADFSRYRIELIEASEGKPRWSDSSIRPTEGLSFTVSFPRSALPAGRYLLRLWGGEGSALRLVANYRFIVVEGSS